MTTWTNEIKPASDNSFLLKEDTFFLLLETGDKIVLTRSLEWTNESKTTTSYTNESKP
jgi:hypothetical protein